jgi:hypothetical protein
MIFVQWLILGTFIFGASSKRLEDWDPKMLKKVEVLTELIHYWYTIIWNSPVFITDPTDKEARAFVPTNK